MAIRYGKTFRTRRGRLGRYKYLNGRRVGFVGVRRFRRNKYRSTVGRYRRYQSVEIGGSKYRRY